MQIPVPVLLTISVYAYGLRNNLSDLVEFNSVGTQRRLRSTTTRAAVVRRTRTKLGRRAFAVCGPDIWNALPPAIRTTLLLCFPAFAKNTPISYCFFKLVLIRVFIIDYIMHGRPIFFVLSGTITLIYVYDYL